MRTQKPTRVRAIIITAATYVRARYTSTRDYARTYIVCARVSVRWSLQKRLCVMIYARAHWLSFVHVRATARRRAWHRRTCVCVCMCSHLVISARHCSKLSSWIPRLSRRRKHTRTKTTLIECRIGVFANSGFCFIIRQDCFLSSVLISLLRWMNPSYEQTRNAWPH